MNREQRSKVILVTSVIGIIVLLRASVAFIPERVETKVTLADDQVTTEEKSALLKQQQIKVFTEVATGEVARTEERVRETSALALAASLYATNAALNGRKIETAEQLLSGLSSNSLLPPNFLLTPGVGGLATSRSNFQLRYRAEPIGIEIISVPKQKSDGLTVIVRVPDDGQSDVGARLYIQNRPDSLPIPQPFAHEAVLVSMGYQPEPFRAASLPNPETRK